MRQRFWLGTAALVVILVRPAAGQFDIGDYSRILEQIDRNTRLMAHTEVPVGQRALLRYGGTLSFDFLAFDDTNQKTHVLRQTTMTGHAQLNLDGAHEFFLRARTSYLDWNTGDSFGESGPFDARTDHGDDWVEPTLDRGHYRFDLRRALQAYEGRTIDGNLVIQGGRQLVHWANGLVLSQEIDGGEITVSIGPWTLETVAGRTRESTTDIDSSRPGYSGDTKRGFYGGMLSYALTPRHRPFVYGLVQQDDNTSDTVVTDANGTPGDPTDDIVTRFDYDSWYVGPARPEASATASRTASRSSTRAARASRTASVCRRRVAGRRPSSYRRARTSRRSRRTSASSTCSRTRTEPAWASR